jgi:preprotein translocase subunit SecA
MSYIRETINWSYGQQTPLVEYNMEASKSFKLMLEQIRSCMIYYFLSNPINKKKIMSKHTLNGRRRKVIKTQDLSSINEKWKKTS